ncbi:hypothetical protein AB0302_04465 [Micrococcus sp. NPDC078436]|uniref:hypothetical protein n=1 Tax=Micrococcus sp. NPDC078436 TaxID=3154960 RepID=UPI00344EFC33
MDLLDFFRGVHSWRRLHTLIQGLPPRSRMELAQLDDDEFIEAHLDQIPEKSGPPRLSEYGPVEQRLDRLTGATEALFKLVADVVKAKPKMPAAPRPAETALQRARKRRAERRIAALQSEALEAIARASTH